MRILLIVMVKTVLAGRVVVVKASVTLFEVEFVVFVMIAERLVASELKV